MPKTSDEGFMLLECVIVAGLLIMLGMLCTLNFSRARAPLASSRYAFMQAVEETRLLASTNVGDASGALLVITSQAQGTDLLILRGRPIDGYAPPSLVPGIPPLHITAQLGLGSSQLHTATLAFAPSGHLDLIASALAPNASPISIAPGCGSSSQALVVTLSTNEQAETESIDCLSGSLRQDEKSLPQ